MQTTMAVIRKELNSFFKSPTAYILFGLFLIIAGSFFSLFVGFYQQYQVRQMMGRGGDLSLNQLATYYYQNIAFFGLFLTPFITMRSFAEESKQQTLQLLLTAPIRGGQLVAAKFMGSYLTVLAMFGLTLIFTFFMVMWGNPEIAVLSTAYLGLALMLACYVALGIFISSLTSNQAIAAAMTLILLIMLWVSQTIGQNTTAKLGALDLGALLTYISPLSHISGFLEGVIHAKDLIYFVSVTFLFLFLTHRVVESHRWR